MDTATLVRNVVTAFDDAVNLVRRIQDRKDMKDDPNAITDLITSLSLGPVVIKGYYDSDVKRFGEAYTMGDQYARDQLKDVLIYLQMSLLTTLRTVLLDDQVLDYGTLLEASDNCRVNAGVCLGQLSQRLAEQSRMYSQGPPAYMSPYLGGLQYSSSQSTHSSGRGRSPDLSMNMNSQFGKLSVHQQQYYDQNMSYGSLQTPIPQRPSHLRQDSTESGDEPATFYFDRNSESPSHRRRSSHTLAPEDVALLSPAGPPAGFGSDRESTTDVLPGAQDLFRESYMTLGGKPIDSDPVRNSNNSLRPVQNPNNSLRPPIQQQSRDHFDPDDFSPVMTLSEGAQQAYANIYVPNQTPNSAPPRSNPPFVPTPLSEHQRYYQAQQDLSLQYQPQRQQTNPQLFQQPSQSAYPIPTRKPVPVPQEMDGQPPRLYDHNLPRQSISAPIPVHTEQNLSTSPNLTHNRPVFSPVQYQQVQPPPPQPYQKPRSPLQMYQQRRQSNDPGSTNMQFESRSPRLTNGNANPLTPRQQIPASNPQSPISPKDGTPLHQVLTNRSIQGAENLPNHTPSVRSLQPSVFSTAVLNLPTDKNTLGLCKGAFRMFIGLEKKAFSLANRPAGISGMISSWRCEKCNFEGPIKEVLSTDPKQAKKGKKEKTFDNTVREMYGIRYRWAFLAKCHVSLKSVPPIDARAKDGSFGSFGCLFCAAEASNRGWAIQTGGDVASTKSGSSEKQSGNSSTPIFGNLQSFMEHMYKHRSEDWWPSSEMQGRMKCIMGRVAESDEEFDINITPLGANA